MFPITPLWGGAGSKCASSSQTPWVPKSRHIVSLMSWAGLASPCSCCLGPLRPWQDLSKGDFLDMSSSCQRGQVIVRKCKGIKASWMNVGSGDRTSGLKMSLSISPAPSRQDCSSELKLSTLRICLGKTASNSSGSCAQLRCLSARLNSRCLIGAEQSILLCWKTTQTLVPTV